MSDTVQTTNSGIGFGGALFLLFLGLKLCHVIAWSWWWVCSPILIPLGLMAVILAVVVGLALAGVGG
jgi:hypothetical protein